MAVMPELRSLSPMLAAASSGIEFAEGTGAGARPHFDALLTASGAEQAGVSSGCWHCCRTPNTASFASAGFRARPEVYALDPLNHVIDHIAKNLCEDLTQTELAELSGYSPTAFSRAFRRHTGLTFTRYVNRMRIDRACELLMTSDESIANICFQVGFNNLSNFNRLFAAAKGMSPVKFRQHYRHNLATRFPDEADERHLQGDGSPSNRSTNTRTKCPAGAAQPPPR